MDFSLNKDVLLYLYCVKKYYDMVSKLFISTIYTLSQVPEIKAVLYTDIYLVKEKMANLN